MLQRTNKENQIGFLSMDFDKLAREVKDIEEARSRKSEPPVRLSKQTTGNLYKQQKANMIGFLEGNSVPTPEVKAEKEVKAEAAKRLDSRVDPHNFFQNSKSVASANDFRPGKVSDFGAPNKYIKSESAASIWDPNKVSSLADELNKTSRERVEEQKAATEEARRTIRQQANDSLVTELQKVDQRKAAQVSSAGTYEGSNYKYPTKGMSIWDSPEALEQFRSEKTQGETIAERRRREAEQKDDSWKTSSGCTSSKSITSRLFDKLLDGK